MRPRLFILAAALSIASASVAEQRTVICKTPAIASSCYTTHGRLSVWNGYVNWRLWKIGTQNMLGIYSGPATFKDRYNNLDSERPELPPNLELLFPNYPMDVSVYADFEVCPLEPHIPGNMQAACIESATHIFVKH
jgi:hypothetical protein